MGAAHNVTSSTTVNLTSSSGNGTFYSDSGGATQITYVTIGASSNSASFFYKDTTAGTPTITADESPDAGYTAATQQETINAAAISKIVFTTSTQTLTAGVVSGIMTIETQDQYSNAKTVSGDTRVDLSSDSSGTKAFYSDSDGVTEITYVTISNGTSSASFYYKDTKAGTPTLTADENPSAGYTAATQQETVNAADISKIVFTTSTQTISAETVSSIMTIQTQDQYSNAKTVSGDTRVYLSSNSSGTATFYSDSGGLTEITYVTISSGASTANFYYKDSVAGTPTLTADENPSAGYTAATQQETISGAPSITNSPSTYNFSTVAASSTTSSGLTHFTLSNNGAVTVNVTISATDMTGGATWTLSDTASVGGDIFGLKAGLETTGSYDVVVKKTGPFNTLVSSLAPTATKTWGLQLLAPTSFSDGGTKSGTVTLTAAQA